MGGKGTEGGEGEGKNRAVGSWCSGAELAHHSEQNPNPSTRQCVCQPTHPPTHPPRFSPPSSSFVLSSTFFPPLLYALGLRVWQLVESVFVWPTPYRLGILAWRDRRTALSYCLFRVRHIFSKHLSLHTDSLPHTFFYIKLPHFSTKGYTNGPVFSAANHYRIASRSLDGVKAH